MDKVMADVEYRAKNRAKKPLTMTIGEHTYVFSDKTGYKQNVVRAHFEPRVKVNPDWKFIDSTKPTKPETTVVEEPTAEVSEDFAVYQQPAGHA